MACDTVPGLNKSGLVLQSVGDVSGCLREPADRGRLLALAMFGHSCLMVVYTTANNWLACVSDASVIDLRTLMVDS